MKINYMFMKIVTPAFVRFSQHIFSTFFSEVIMIGRLNRIMSRKVFCTLKFCQQSGLIRSTAERLATPTCHTDLGSECKLSRLEALEILRPVECRLYIYLFCIQLFYNINT